MSRRIIDLADGFSAVGAPTVNGARALITGSTGSPSNIVAGTGVTINDVEEEVIFVDGTGGVDITVNPQIAAATNVGQRVTLIGTSDANAVQLDDGNGLSQNGTMILKNKSVISYLWNGTVYEEEYRK